MRSFGKRIYYDETTGNVLLITNEMKGEGIQQLTPAEEHEIYNALSGRVTGSYSFIQLEYGEYAKEFTDGLPTHYDVQSELLTWTWHDSQTVEERKTLEQEVDRLSLELADRDARLADVELALIELFGGVA